MADKSWLVAKNAADTSTPPSDLKHRVQILLHEMHRYELVQIIS